MSEVEKLRTLLAEAQALLLEARPTNERCDCTQCKPIDMINARIDAALAEPVEGPLNAISRLQQQLHEAKSNADWLVQRAQRERDEARAEVERLRGTWKWDAIKAYKRGAQAMREEAARLVHEMLSHTLTDAADRIRDLPIPEDAP